MIMTPHAWRAAAGMPLPELAASLTFILPETRAGADHITVSSDLLDTDSDGCTVETSTERSRPPPRCQLEMHCRRVNLIQARRTAGSDGCHVDGPDSDRNSACTTRQIA